MIVFTLRTISRDVRGIFFGRTVRRGLADVSRFRGDVGRVGDLVLNETRLVDFFKLDWERVCIPSGLVMFPPPVVDVSLDRDDLGV
jgi:hypothetical protein